MKISKKATTIAIVNQKGGTGKTTTCENPTLQSARSVIPLTIIRSFIWI